MAKPDIKKLLFPPEGSKINPITGVQEGQSSSAGATGPKPPATSTTINFKSDGSVEYTPTGGQTQTLSKEQYKELLDYQRAGKTTSTQPMINEALKTPEMRLREQQAQIFQQNTLTQGGMQQIGEGEITPIDWKQVGLSTITDPSTIKNVGMGAIGGAIGGSKVGAIGGPWGAVAGAAIGVFAGVMSNIRSQKSDNVAKQKQILTDDQKYANYFISMAQVDPANLDQYVEGYRLAMNNIGQAYSNLKAETSSNLNLMVEQDGTTELQRFENFFDGMKPILDAKMQMAIAAPDPAKAIQELAMTMQSIGEQ